ncbi:MAG: DUF5688 family protein [Eubacteriales bacterium]
MEYKEFVCAIQRDVNVLVGKDMRVELHTAIKNNGKERVALIIRDEAVNITPSIYLEEYFEQLQEGRTIRDIVEAIIELYDQIKLYKSIDVDVYDDYSKVRSMLACKIINLEKNKKLLEDTPYKKILDLAIVFYLLADAGPYGSSTMLIKKEHIDQWNVSLEELSKDAMRNVEKILPFQFQTMTSVVCEILDEKAREELEGREERMYVLSNARRCLGAASMFYKGRLKAIGEALGENFYILPSSIHEVIIVPESKAPSEQDIVDMITEINDTQVDEEEVLSYHPYYYICERERLLY